MELSKLGIIDQDLQSVVSSLVEASKVISNLVRRAPLGGGDLLGLEGNVNVQGEDQKKLDVITNDVMKSALRYSGKLGTLASEEEDAPVAGAHQTSTVGDVGSGKYICVFDPLDG